MSWLLGWQTLLGPPPANVDWVFALGFRAVRPSACRDAPEVVLRAMFAHVCPGALSKRLIRHVDVAEDIASPTALMSMLRGGTVILRSLQQDFKEIKHMSTVEPRAKKSVAAYVRLAGTTLEFHAPLVSLLLESLVTKLVQHDQVDLAKCIQEDVLRCPESPHGLWSLLSGARRSCQQILPPRR